MNAAIQKFSSPTDVRNAVNRTVDVIYHVPVENDKMNNIFSEDRSPTTYFHIVCYIDWKRSSNGDYPEFKK